MWSGCAGKLYADEGGFLSAVIICIYLGKLILLKWSDAQTQPYSEPEISSSWTLIRMNHPVSTIYYYLIGRNQADTSLSPWICIPGTWKRKYPWRLSNLMRLSEVTAPWHVYAPLSTKRVLPSLTRIRGQLLDSLVP